MYMYMYMFFKVTFGASLTFDRKTTDLFSFKLAQSMKSIAQSELRMY